VDPVTASKIVWLDCLIMNVDRTFRNTNMLIWKSELWLIDHGASFYFHNSWPGWEDRAAKPFALIKDHVLLPQASELPAADAFCKALLTPELVQEIVALIPEEWIMDDEVFPDKAAQRYAYADFLNERIALSSNFVNAAIDARKALV
jgi:hypothetical protein